MENTSAEAAKYLIQSFHGFAAPYFVSFMNGESSFFRTRRTHSSRSSPFPFIRQAGADV